MNACSVRRLTPHAPSVPAAADGASPAPTDRPADCDVCGSPALVWVRCKLVCRNCRTIVMSCADL